MFWLAMGIFGLVGGGLGYKAMDGYDDAFYTEQEQAEMEARQREGNGSFIQKIQAIASNIGVFGIAILFYLYQNKD